MIKIGPVSIDKFSARESELKRLDKIQSDYLSGYRRNLAVLGPWSIGKTSLMLKFIHDRLDPDLFPIYLNLEDGFLKESFFGFLLYSLRSSSLKDNNYSLDSVGDSAVAIEKEYPQLAPVIKNIESGHKNNNYLAIMDSILRLPDIVKKKFGKNCIFIIDEFFSLDKLKVSSWMQILRDHIMLDKHTLFVLISSEIERSKSVLNSEFSLLFGNFEIIELDNFSYQESIDFTQSRLGSIKIQEHNLTEKMIALTNGLPLYLDILTSWIDENADIFDWQTLIVMLKEVLLNNKGFLYRYFSEKLRVVPGDDKFQEFLPFVTEVARGNTKKRELKKKDFSYATCNYSMNGFLEKNGSFFRIKDPLFRIWLLCAYNADLMGLKLSSELKEEMLAREIQAVGSPLNIFLNSDNVENMVTRLILNFDNEFIEIEGKKRQLPKILTVKNLFQYQTFSAFQADKEKAGRWLFVVIRSEFQEQDTYSLLESLQSKDFKFNQKIAVMPQREDSNISLILKTKGFWVWDMKLINRIIEFYGLSRDF
ncbi:MAG: ATP-binding protein [Candidatus Omnitrophica bacterium]|nr:ATP-binding protein [Candidatus Omnitrophota bacterium]